MNSLNELTSAARTDGGLGSAAHTHDSARFIAGSQQCRLLVVIGEQRLFLRLAAVPREVAVNAAVEAPPDRRLRFLPSLPLDRCEELVIAPFPASLTALLGTLAPLGILRDQRHDHRPDL
jgi:hypothetical protein